MTENLHRRQWLALAAGMLGSAAAGGVAAATGPAAGLLHKPVGTSGVSLPVIGLGSWITFNVGDDAQARASCAEVMRHFFQAGGRMIDSSPMYGSSQPVIGAGLQALHAHAQVFSTDKVWTSGDGRAQIEASRRHWGVRQFDLLQVHNLLAWEPHLQTLAAMKAEGRIRHVGLSTSEGRRHDTLERLLRTQPVDVVQLTYNPLDREAESHLLPLAQERGIAVLVNRPFRQGALIDALNRHPVPAWAAELGCDGWAQLVLKWILAHPAVTCVIPATTQVTHVRQNLGAAVGPLPDAAMRRRIASTIAAL